MNSTVIPIHTKVKGRARFKVDVLARSSRARLRVDAEAKRLPGVNRIRINSTTGSLLVFFDPKEDWRTIGDRIADVIGIQETREVVSRKWHQLEAQRTLELVGTAIDRGLHPESVDQRLRIHGSNVVDTTRVRDRSKTLKDQVMNLPMVLLSVEAFAALFVGAVIESALLSIIMVLNVAVGYFIDRRTEQAIAAFKHRPQPTATVLREGSWVDVPGEMLVPGDILRMTPGTYVGADSRILRASHLKIDESILTGESNPVDKHAEPIHGRSAPLFDQRNMAFMGTLVVGGAGVAVVVATGPKTEYGKLNALFNETIPPKTPVIDKIKALSGALLRVAIVMSAGVFLFGLMRGRGLFRSAGRALSIAAAGVPAGLPSAATVNMALGFRRLQQENISVRRLYSLESLSAVQTICFDKTGTLTRSRINVQQIYCSGRNIRVHERALWVSQEPFAPLENADFRRLLQACVLCSESRVQLDTATRQRQISGSPTERALLHLAVMSGFDLDAGYRRHPLQKVQHRSDFKRYMVTVHAAPGGKTLIFAKGDPSEVLEICSRQLHNGRPIAMSEAAQNEIEIQNQRMAGEGQRVLGFAYNTLTGSPDDPSSLRDLTWIGLIGMAEPVREGVVSLIEQLHQAGIKTVMITGDQSTTAEAVARRIQLCDPSTLRVFDSSRFDTLTPELASALVRDVHLFARVNPAQKLQIVQAYQHRGMVVAMTGDGINDGPALRAADVGIAMGLSGTHAAREVADMVLERDNITSVAVAVWEGRAAYRNLKRSLRYFITTHFSDILLTTVASTFSPGTALLAFRPVQVNLLADLAPGLALLMEPASPRIGREPPREREEPLFARRDLIDLLSESIVLTGGALAAFSYGLLRYGPGPAAATLAFESLSTANVLHALTCRPWVSDSPKTPLRRANPLLSKALTASLVAQAGTILIPGLRRLLNIAPLTLSDLAVVGLTALTTRLINHKIREKRQTEGGS